MRTWKGRELGTAAARGGKMGSNVMRKEEEEEEVLLSTRCLMVSAMVWPASSLQALVEYSKESIMKRRASYGLSRHKRCRSSYTILSRRLASMPHNTQDTSKTRTTAIESSRGAPVSREQAKQKLKVPICIGSREHSTNNHCLSQPTKTSLDICVTGVFFRSQYPPSS